MEIDIFLEPTAFLLSKILISIFWHAKPCTKVLTGRSRFLPKILWIRIGWNKIEANEQSAEQKQLLNWLDTRHYLNHKVRLTTNCRSFCQRAETHFSNFTEEINSCHGWTHDVPQHYSQKSRQKLSTVQFTKWCLIAYSSLILNFIPKILISFISRNVRTNFISFWNKSRDLCCSILFKEYFSFDWQA